MSNAAKQSKLWKIFPKYLHFSNAVSSPHYAETIFKGVLALYLAWVLLGATAFLKLKGYYTTSPVDQTVTILCVFLLLCSFFKRMSVFSFLKEDVDFIALLSLYGLVMILRQWFTQGAVTDSGMISVTLIPVNILIFFVLAPKILSINDYDWIIKSSVILFMFILLLEIISQLFALNQVVGAELYKIKGINGSSNLQFSLFDHKNTVGRFYQWLPAALVYLFVKDYAAMGRVKLNLMIISFFVVLIYLIYSQSRQAHMVVILSLLPATVVFVKKYKVVSMAMFTFVASFFLVVPEVWEWFDQVFGVSTRYSVDSINLSGRPVLWTEFFEHLGAETKYLAGFGYLGASMRSMYPHSSGLSHLVFFGGLGFVFYLALMFNIVRRVYHKVAGRLNNELPLLTMLMLFVGLIFESAIEDILLLPFWFPFVLFWFLAGFLTVGENQRKYEKSPAGDGSL